MGRTQWPSSVVVLTIASVFDLRSRRIPNWLTAGAFVVGSVMALTQNSVSCTVAAPLLSMLVMWCPVLFGNGAVGAGDIKLAGALGTLLGTAFALLVIAAAACGALITMALMKLPDRIRNQPTTVPFAPFLLAGNLLAAWVRF